MFCFLWVSLLTESYSFANIPNHSDEIRSQIDDNEMSRIAHQIYLNETGGKPENLISWNEGERFLSLGIGHFIWFPRDLDSRFTETFPELITFLRSRGHSIPAWLQNDLDCPWSTKDMFERAKSTPKFQSLYQLMQSSFEDQLRFIMQRKESSLSLMLSNLSSEIAQKELKARFEGLKKTPIGLYSLVDYVNFKGEGISPKERYEGKGWGLLQVLQGMDTQKYTLHDAFTQSCIKVLSERIQNSPQREIEERWLVGWTKRCETYSSYSDFANE